MSSPKEPIVNKESLVRYNVTDGTLEFISPSPEALTYSLHVGAYPLPSGEVVVYRNLDEGYEDFVRVVYDADGTEVSRHAFSHSYQGYNPPQLNRTTNKQVYIGNTVVDAYELTLRAFSTDDHAFKWEWTPNGTYKIDGPWIFPGEDRVYAATYDGMDDVTLYAVDVLDGTVITQRTYSLELDNAPLGMLGTKDHLVFVEAVNNTSSPVIVILDKNTLAEVERWVEGAN